MTVQVKDLVQTPIPTQYGEFILHYYQNNYDDKEHVALVKGEVAYQENVAVRIHSECFTGDVLGSRRCDCGEQLALAMQLIQQANCGVLIYLRQEGRGIGLFKKLQAYNLQDAGLDTVDANIELGYLADEREYTIAALILQNLNIKSVRLLTNNPQKINALTALGIEVTGRIPVEITANNDNIDYLKTKADKMAHLLFANK
ncbi:MAG: GTP cyclohydrolase II [Methylococcaceae bacterium]